jgi:hypothetical protein
MSHFGLKLVISLASLAIVFIPSAKAVELQGGRTAFSGSPQLLEATTTFNSVRAWGAKYYFTIALPKDAGEPLGKITIQQKKSSDDIDFYADETFAFAGDRSQEGENLSLGTVNWQEDTKTITIVFDPPLAPGQTATIGLKPKRNPDYGGVYLFGVTAFPAGENPQGLYLGAGRLNFYDGGDGVLFNPY